MAVYSGVSNDFERFRPVLGSNVHRVVVSNWFYSSPASFSPNEAIFWQRFDLTNPYKKFHGAIGLTWNLDTGRFERIWSSFGPYGVSERLDLLNQLRVTIGACQIRKSISNWCTATSFDFGVLFFMRNFTNHKHDSIHILTSGYCRVILIRQFQSLAILSPNNKLLLHKNNLAHKTVPTHTK